MECLVHQRSLVLLGVLETHRATSPCSARGAPCWTPCRRGSHHSGRWRAGPASSP
ncbi:hypothetical protein JYU34_021871 [Plutella xylostella]|uniref:Uncharacterized protein n=1 Tax=Plutella xylostella TaxID=51655 RepID=A0ABQ7PRK4_PLUXY|nr:hypothetical protein JYU34_021871 [Plutella xylostella]